MFRRQRVGGPFDDLVDVRVVEGVPRAERPGRQPAGDLEVLDAARVLALLEGGRQRDGADGLQPGRPERVGESDVGQSPPAMVG